MQRSGFWLVVACLLLPTRWVWAQSAQWQADTLAVMPANVVQAATDQYNRVLLALETGSLVAIDAQGKLIYEYAPQQLSAPTLIEAAATQRVLLFYREWQQITLLDRFLSLISTFDLQELGSGYVRLATRAQNNSYWLIDEVDFSLKKTDPQASQIWASTPLNLLIEPGNYLFAYLREYQNNLYVSDVKSGILVFDNMGGYVRKIPILGVNFFDFDGDYLIYCTANGVEGYHLYHHTTSSLLHFTAPIPKKPMVLKSNSGFYIIAGKNIIAFRKKR